MDVFGWLMVVTVILVFCGFWVWFDWAVRDVAQHAHYAKGLEEFHVEQLEEKLRESQAKGHEEKLREFQAMGYEEKLRVLRRMEDPLRLEDCLKVIVLILALCWLLLGVACMVQQAPCAKGLRAPESSKDAARPRCFPRAY